MDRYDMVTHRGRGKVLYCKPVKNDEGKYVEYKDHEKQIKELENDLHIVQSTAGKWMSACLSDNKACDEIKVDFGTALEILRKGVDPKLVGEPVRVSFGGINAGKSTGHSTEINFKTKTFSRVGKRPKTIPPPSPDTRACDNCNISFGHICEECSSRFRRR